MPATPEGTHTRLKQQRTDRGPWQQTCSGRAFFLGDPRPEEVHVTDIAHALAHQGRYNGHTKTFYSIAQHAALIARWMAEDGCTLDQQFAGLHHDSAEAYTGDIVAQLKYLVPDFRRIEDAVEGAVFEALGIDMSKHKAITKQYDFLALATERRDLLEENQTQFSWGDLPDPRRSRIFAWPPEWAAHEFLRLHTQLKIAMDFKELHDGV